MQKGETGFLTQTVFTIYKLYLINVKGLIYFKVQELKLLSLFLPQAVLSNRNCCKYSTV